VIGPAASYNAATVASMNYEVHLPGGYSFWCELRRTPYMRSSRKTDLSARIWLIATIYRNVEHRQVF